MVQSEKVSYHNKFWILKRQVDLVFIKQSTIEGIGPHPVDLETVSPYDDCIRTRRGKLRVLFSGCPPIVRLPLSICFSTTVALSSPGGFLVAFGDRPRLFSRWLKRCTRSCGESHLTSHRRLRSPLFVGVRFGVLSPWSVQL